jgi:Carboxypeptidase regulatory-like domain/TonB dependent receptor
MFVGFRVFFIALVLTIAGYACAQNLFFARGTVVDTTGAVVPGLSVAIHKRNGTPIAETKSDAMGNFTFTSLPAGDVVLSVPAAAGFAERTLPLHLTANVTGLRVSLTLASISQEITVGKSRRISTDSSSNRDTVSVSGDDLRKLPSFDMDYISTLSSFLDASSASSGGVTLIVDGIEMKSAGVSPSAIQEIRINNDPYTAEYSRPGRGRIEITTKPGSPEYHGEFNFLYRDSIFNAKNYFAATRPPETRRMFEGNFTGPVGNRGRTTFIASGEYGKRDIETVVNAHGPGGNIIENVPNPQLDTRSTLRVTHDFSTNHRLQMGYNFEYGTETNAGVGALVLPEAGTNEMGREDDLILNDRIIVTPNLINQFLVTLEKDEDNTSSVTNTQSIQVNGAFTGGGAQADVHRTENTIHVNEIVSWSHGKHYIRFGAQAPQVSKRAVDDQTNRLGTYQFNSLADYGQPNTGAHPNSFTQQQGPGRGLYWINELGAFVQDQVKFNARLQASFGLRYDWQTYISDNNNLSPRVSLAYAPGKGKTVVRIGSGLFYDRTGGDRPAIFKLHNGTVLDTIQIDQPAYPPASGTLFSSIPSNIVREASNLRAPYTIQSSIGVERQISKKTIVTATYRNSIQAKSFRSRDANAPILPPNHNPNVVYPRPNPSVGQIQQVESGGRQLLNALDLSLRGQVASWFSGQAQYTLSRVENNTGGIGLFPQDQYNPNNEWGRANFDRLHALNILGQIYPDHWLTLGVNASIYSGMPYTETTGTDDFQTNLNNARPNGVGRNTLQGKTTANLDLQWEHEFKLTKPANDDHARVITAGVSAFNVLNHPNFSGYIGAQNSPFFMQPTSAPNGRQIQLSVGFRF